MQLLPFSNGSAPPLRPINLINTLTAPQVIQFLVVTAFSLAALYLMVTGQPVPDLLTYILTTTIGYFFGANEPPQLFGKKPEEPGD